MVARVIEVTDNMLLGIMRNMLNRNEITLEQYADSLRRSNGKHHSSLKQGTEVLKRPQVTSLPPQLALGRFNFFREICKNIRRTD